MKSKLSSICEYRKGKVDVASLTPSNYVSTENMLPNKGGITPAASLPNVNQTQAYKKGDVLVSNIRPYFKKIWKAKTDGGCSNDVLVFVAKKEIDPDYLFYVLADDAFFEYSMASSKGTKMPRGDKKAIMLYEVRDNDIYSQRRIASILRALDDKIELNIAINDNLEQQAEAVFREKLLIEGDLPEGWKKSSLSGIADYLNGLAMQKFRPAEDEIGLPVLKIKELRQGSFDESTELCSPSIKPEFIVHDGDVIFSWSGSLLVDFWCGGTCGLNQHLFKVTSQKFDKWFYYVWTKYHLDNFIAVAADKATTMGHIKREELDKAVVFVPSPEDYALIGELLAPVYDAIISNRLEARKLGEIRDSLLPKLMSGELDVSEVSL